MDRYTHGSAAVTTPLISCIMPTRGRPEFVRQAHRLWERQTWPERELVVIVDEDDPETLSLVDELADTTWNQTPMRIVRVPAGTTLGDKRNAGVEAARGEYV